MLQEIFSASMHSSPIDVGIKSQILNDVALTDSPLSDSPCSSGLLGFAWPGGVSDCVLLIPHPTIAS